MKLNTLLAMIAVSACGLTVPAQTVDTVTTNGLFEPYGVTVDLSTNVYYFTDSANNRIVRYDPAKAELTTLATLLDETNHFAGFPEGIVIARDGLVVSDAFNSAIYRVTFDGDTSLLAGGTRGLADGPAPSARFSSPYGMAVDGSGNIYIADSKNNAVRRLAVDDTVTTYYAIGFDEPSGVAVGEAGEVFVADTRNHVVKVIEADKTVSVIAGQQGLSGSDDGTGGSARFNGPRGLLWVGGETGLLVADSGNDSIRRLRLKSGIWKVDTFAGLSGSPGSGNGKLLDARFSSPIGMARDAEGAILIADLYNNALRRITLPAAPLPVVLPLGGSFSNSISVTVTSAAPNTVIRYTTNGSDPTPLSTSLTGPLPLAAGPVAFKVRGFHTDLATSGTVSNGYSFFVNPLAVSVPGGSFTNNVDLQVATLTANVSIRFTTDGSEPATNSLVWNDRDYGQTGPIIFRAFRDGFDPTPLSSNYFTFVVSQPVIAPGGATTNNVVPVTFASSTVGAQLFWTIDGSEPNTNSTLYTVPFVLGTNGTLNVKGFKAGYLASATSSAQFNLTVATPAILPGGAVTNNNVTVALVSDTAGAQLRYTLDDSDPTEASAPYNGPFALGANSVLKVKGFKSGFVPSQTVTAVFSFTASDPVITPAGATANNNVPVEITSATRGAQLYWTIDGSNPTTNSLAYTGSFVLGTNGVLKARAFKNGYAVSQISSATFNLLASAPTIKPAGATDNNSVAVTLNSATAGAKLYWTIDGDDPTSTSTLYSGPFTLGTNGTLKVIAIKDGFVNSEVASATFNLSVAKPLVSPDGGTTINSVTVSMSSATANAELRFTLDGSEPTSLSPLYAEPFALTTNATAKVAGFRNGFVASPATTADFKIQVDTPRLTPASGFFPNGTTVTLTVARTNAVIYYTLNGQDPTPSDTQYTGPFQLNGLSAPGQDLRALKARAFALGAEPSDIVSGQPVQENALGVPRDAFAGIGSTIVVPVVVNLQTNRLLKTLQFRVQVAPAAPTVPSLVIDLRALNITTNDFIQVVGPGDNSGSATLSVSSYRDPGPGGVFTNGLTVYAVGTNANFSVQNFATVAMLAISIPPTAKEGDTYQVDIVAPSGTSDGQQGAITLTPLASRVITVKNIPYLVGDSSPSGWYNAGDFGNGDLDNADVNNAFYASLGIRVPYSFTDVFDAMDTFPDDVAGAVGGDGQIRFLDWQRILRRSLRRDTNNWQRGWTAGGVRVATRTNLAATVLSQQHSDGLSGQLWQPQAQVGAVSKGNVNPGSLVQVPVYVNTAKGAKLAGLQFRAVIQPQDDAPALQQPAQFEPADSLPTPLRAGGLPNEQVAAAWSLLPTPLALENSNHVGYVSFVVPASAPAGSSYTINFANADGSPDLNTQYDFTVSAASVAVQAPATPPPDTGKPAHGFKLNWFAALGKSYVLESTTDLSNTHWTVVADNIIGSGRMQEFIDTDTNSSAKFYRVRLKP